MEKYNASGICIGREISKCTARATDTLTVVRLAEACPASDAATTQSLTAQAFAIGDYVYSAFTADAFDDVQDEVTRLETAKFNKAGGTITGVTIMAQGANIAAASTTDLSTATGNEVHITAGAGTINSFGTVAAGAIFDLTFDVSVILTYNATSLIIPGSLNITTAIGDVARVKSEGSGNWQVLQYTKRDGTPVISSGVTFGQVLGATLGVNLN